MYKIAPLGRTGLDMARWLTLLVALFAAPAMADPGATLALEDCRISAGPGFPSTPARCATFVRPENPEEPGSDPIELRVAVVPALNLTPEPDPFVPIAGGPGQGSVEFYSVYAAAFEHVRRDRDILLVDQRGTGASARMDCPLDDTLFEGHYSIDQTVAATEACLAQLQNDPRFFTTSVAVTDLEAVRDALGYSQLNLYGVSYGSRVAQHFARRYPGSTRSVILDGVVPPQIPLGTEIATEAQRAIDDIFSRCADDAACSERFPDLAGEFATLLNRLDGDPVIVELQDPVTGSLESIDFGRGELTAAIRLLAYHPTTIALLPLMVHDAARGNFIPLAAQFRQTTTDIARSLALGMHNSVMCSEDAPLFDDFDIDVEAIEASYIGPLQLEAIEAMCSVWPTGPVDEGFHEPLETVAPVLLLSGAADPITPPRYAELAADALAPERYRHLVGEHQGHGQAAVGCMPRIVADFVSNLDPAGLDADCMSRSFAMPFFMDYSGPRP